MSPSLKKKNDSKKAILWQWPRGSEAFEVSQIKGRVSSLDGGGEGTKNHLRALTSPGEEVRLPLGATLAY